MVLCAVGVKVGEAIASQTLLAFSEWRENAVDPGAPPASRLKVPFVTLQPERLVSKS